MLIWGFISFSAGIVTFRNAEQLRDAARYVPLDVIKVETDSLSSGAGASIAVKRTSLYGTRRRRIYGGIERVAELKNWRRSTDNFCSPVPAASSVSPVINPLNEFFKARSGKQRSSVKFTCIQKGR